MIKINYDNKIKVLFVECSGIIEIEDMLEYVNNFGNDNTLPRDLLIFENASKADVKFTANDLPLLLEKLFTVLPNYKTIKHAVIHSDPVNTAFAMIINKETTNNNYKIKVFSTEKAAMDWLKTDKN